jgi:hypothetical protein
MWCHYLHVANFATMAVGLWAALVLVQEVRRPIRLSGALGVLLLVLSLGYQYQWIMVPMLGVLLVSRGGMRPRTKCLVLLGAILFYVLSAAGVRGALDLVGLARSEAYGGVVSEPGVLIRAKLAAVRSAADLPTLLPPPSLVVEMAQTYHPLVFGVGAAGLWLLPPRARWLALVSSAAALGSLSLYPRPWTAMSAYPLIYLGAAMSCVAIGMTIGRLVARAGTLGSSPIAVTAATQLVTVVLALGLAAVTNLDLIGDPRFLLSFWRLYAEPAVF